MPVIVVLLDRRLEAGEAAVDGDVSDGRSLSVGSQNVLTGRSRGEVAAKDRLIDVVRADFEVIAHPAERHRPREIVFELTLDLKRVLRRVNALADGNTRWVDDCRIVRIGINAVLEVRVLEQEFIQHAGADLPRMTRKN